MQKVNPHDFISILSEKWRILICHFQLFLNVTRKVGAFLGSCWATYRKKGHKCKKSNPYSWKTHAKGSGDSHFSLSYLLQIRKKSATRIVSKTSEAIIQVLLQDYMTPQEMRSSGKTLPKNLVTYGNSHTL